MSTLNKAVVSAVIAGVVVFGFFRAFQSNATQAPLVAGSPAGSTFSTEKIASQVVPVSTSTLFSILNTDSSDRVIVGADVFLIGTTTTTQIATTSTFRIACATSSVSTGFSVASPNFIYDQTILANALEPFGTTTSPTGYYVASSSPGITGTTTPNFAGGAGVFVNQFARVWKTNTNLVCELTASGNATNLLSSTTAGTITFRYRSQ